MPDKKRPQLYDAYDADRPLLVRCACGEEHAPVDHQAARNPRSVEEFSRAIIEASVEQKSEDPRISSSGLLM